MKEWLVDFLCCTSCKGNLELDGRIHNQGEIESGSLKCCQCSRIFIIDKFIPRFTDSDKYVSNFSFEWNTYATTQYGELSRKTFFEKTGLSKKDIDGKIVFDAGCGSGRFSDVVSQNCEKVIAADLSYSIDAAFSQIGSRSNVSFVQCDLLNLPFKPQVFDIAFSIGVLHHTQNPKEAMKQISQTIKSNGIMAIWVYAHWSETNKIGRFHRTFARWSYAASDVYRVFTTRLSNASLYKLIKALSFIFYLKQKNKFAYLFDLIFPSSNSADYEMWLLDTFDWYSPKYQYKLTYAEVMAWYNEFGFKQLEKLESPVAVSGRLRDRL